MRNQYTSYIMSNYIDWGTHCSHIQDNHILLIIRIFNKNNKKYGLAGDNKKYGLAGGDLYIWLFY